MTAENEESELPLSQDREAGVTIARLEFIPDDDVVDGSLSNQRVFKEAQCDAGEIRHGWHPNLGGRK